MGHNGTTADGPGFTARLVVGIALLIAAAVFAVARAAAGVWHVNGAWLWAALAAIVGVMLVSQHVHDAMCDDADTEGNRE